MRVDLQTTVSLLQSSQIVAIPTETVYGLAASIYHPDAIEKIFKIKKRPVSNPLIVHASNLKQLSFIDQNLPCFASLHHHFWPGPLTLVVPVQGSINKQITANSDRVAIRLPAHPLTKELLEMTGPLVAPSANLSGKPSPTRAQHVLDDYQDQIAVLDGGECSKGVESTILIWNSDKFCWCLGRLGAIEPEAFSSILGYLPVFDDSKVACPGQHWRHYAPLAKLNTLNSHQEKEKILGAVIGFEERKYKANLVLYLGSIQQPEACLMKLYHTLRQLDQLHVETAWIDMDFPKVGLWQTLKERLDRAKQ
jgi:L-threonylcarbamoyladenylate synthase